MGLLSFRDVHVEFARKGRAPVHAVAGVDLDLEEGEILGLVGESGCGKSTLARAGVGLMPLSGGEVVFDGEPIRHVRGRARPERERKLQMVFQDPFASLNPRRRIGEQITDALRGHASRQERRRRAGALLEQVGLEARDAPRYPHQFSGGQRQRIAIARALAPEPRVIVADEPVAALDASIQAQVANVLVELRRDLGLSILFISHDLSLVRHVCDRVAVMYLGRIAELGPTASMWRLPLHPYTEALIRAVPHPEQVGVAPSGLPGEVPDPADPPDGCVFHPRCPYAHDACMPEHPSLRTVGDARQVACVLHEPGGQARRPEEAARAPAGERPGGAHP
ncbi:ABC transporter ATP-binding protein [Egibacter rhizosphaerae]|uniref:ABC transporter ATP-binding protein n=1 Tax=Egibacter rhizosphaerae TaxID=1670831 RepID=A0A411YL99_9ACTN|nr:ABC transporter ATP-binding protein [Egibacter rhizosphaerae]